ncbi:MAG TPA: hypothetical protein VGV38_04950, partial [Pyrinomonadaceae bacterium]|nr:hypothetical protein [Pyrinomonadaceae bacterium]
SNTASALRAAGGCADSNNNAADFSTNAPNPRNTASPAATCAQSAPSSAFFSSAFFFSLEDGREARRLGPRGASAEFGHLSPYFISCQTGSHLSSRVFDTQTKARRALKARGGGRGS